MPPEPHEAPSDEYFSAVRYVIDKLFHADGPSPSARTTAVAIASRMRKQSDGRYSAWPGYADLMTRTGHTRKTIAKNIKELCEGPDAIFEKRQGRLTPRGRAGDRRNDTNFYTLIVRGRTSRTNVGRRAANPETVRDRIYGDASGTIHGPVDRVAELDARRSWTDEATIAQEARKIAMATRTRYRQLVEGDTDPPAALRDAIVANVSMEAVVEASSLFDVDW